MGLGRFPNLCSSLVVTNSSLGSNRFSQTTTDLDGQRWLSFGFPDSLDTLCCTDLSHAGKVTLKDKKRKKKKKE
jgi:hypothetical protein